MVCASQYENQAGLCYTPCPPATHAFVTMCIAKCPADLPYDCGVICAKDLKGCAEGIYKAGSAAKAVTGLTACLGTAAATAGLSTLACGYAVYSFASSAHAAAVGWDIC
jgi:hypothetical protein